MYKSKQPGEKSQESGAFINLTQNKIQNKQLNKNIFTDNNKTSKFIQALDLPILCNINPRSVYNKIDEFQTFVQQEELDVILMSESWERQDKSLNQIIDLEDYTIVSNVADLLQKAVASHALVRANNLHYCVL